MIPYVAIYDDTSRRIDRYTVVLHPGWCLSVNDESQWLYGISCFGNCTPGPHLGKRVRLDDLPPAVQQHILERLS